MCELQNDVKVLRDFDLLQLIIITSTKWQFNEVITDAQIYLYPNEVEDLVYQSDEQIYVSGKTQSDQ